MAKHSFFDTIVTQWRTIPPVLTADLSGKTVIVIGANTGLGLATTKHFAKMKPSRLIMGCRNEGKGKAAVVQVEAATGYKPELWSIDLSSFASVSDFATRFEKDGGRLDYLIMNAGVGLFEYSESPDGYEMSIQVNHLATSLLTLLLVPTMARTAQENSTRPRVVIVASASHYNAPVSAILDKPDFISYVSSAEYCTPANMKGQYHISKLLNVFFARSYAAHFTPQGPPITIVSCCPGFCESEFRRNMPPLIQYLIKLVEKLIIITAEQGSRLFIRAAIWDKPHEELNGQYLACEKVTEPSDLVISEEGAVLQEKIWRETIDILSKADPRVSDIHKEFFTN